MQIKSAIGTFLAEFSKFESESLAIALRAFSSDRDFAKQTQELLGLDARLTLLERLAFSRGISQDLQTLLEGLLIRASKLRDQRDELLRAIEPAMAEHNPRSPRSLAQVQGLATEAITLQQEFSAFANRIGN